VAVLVVIVYQVNVVLVNASQVLWRGKNQARNPKHVQSCVDDARRSPLRRSE
jgi:hypothetical protein